MYLLNVLLEKSCDCSIRVSWYYMPTVLFWVLFTPTISINPVIVPWNDVNKVSICIISVHSKHRQSFSSIFCSLSPVLPHPTARGPKLAWNFVQPLLQSHSALQSFNFFQSQISEWHPQAFSVGRCDAMRCDIKNIDTTNTI